MTPHHDQQYIEALHRGDPRLIQEIYNRFSRDVLQWILQNNGNADDAQDVFQDALMAIYDRYCGTDFQLNGSFGGLLMTICRRKWYDRLAQKKREQDVRNTELERYTEESPEWEAAEEAIRQQQRQACLAEVFPMLSEQCQQLLTLAIHEGLSVEQIAQQLGMTNANAVYQSKHRCTARWRQLFYEHFKEHIHE
ncbi:MAG TPA: sigma-70 family RNA polymerase sigma factor [Saprospiraceae bacterium]|nr:sigma-70 family RNA polymerase sigma factor [Saprospiraceae bacterium]HMP23111.1 sigma-70 family RNA polymerase sigma factor [Saprospiraceae bacterium]